MWGKIVDLAKKLLNLAHETERNKTEIEDLRQEVRQLSALVERVIFELQRVKENETHEREKMALRLENTLLRFERRLPEPKQSSNPTETEPTVRI
jgi:predicted  nucleic acid-binding Zn-ribbon protein